MMRPRGIRFLAGRDALLGLLAALFQPRIEDGRNEAHQVARRFAFRIHHFARLEPLRLLALAQHLAQKAHALHHRRRIQMRAVQIKPLDHLARVITR